MKYSCILMVTLLTLCCVSAAHAEHRIGAGIHYWMAVEDIDIDDANDSGLAWVFSYQYRPAWLLTFEVDLEVLPDHYLGAPEEVYAPQAYAFLGDWIYAGVGIGVLYSDGEFADNPFYRLRAGLDLELLPHIHLDIHANYQFLEWDALDTLGDDLSTDTVTLGATARLEF